METLPFGKKLRVSNFEVLKYTKTVDGATLRRMRSAKGIPADMQRSLTRGVVPYIRVSAIGGMWAVELSCVCAMFVFIDHMKTCDAESVKGHRPCFTEESELQLAHLFTMWYADTSVFGDDEYMKSKAEALKAFTERIKAPEIEKKADDKILEESRALSEAEEGMAGIAEDITDKTEKG